MTSRVAIALPAYIIAQNLDSPEPRHVSAKEDLGDLKIGIFISMKNLS